MQISSSSSSAAKRSAEATTSGGLHNQTNSSSNKNHAATAAAPGLHESDDDNGDDDGEPILVASVDRGGDGPPVSVYLQRSSNAAAWVSTLQRHKGLATVVMLLALVLLLFTSTPTMIAASANKVHVAARKAVGRIGVGVGVGGGNSNSSATQQSWFKGWTGGGGGGGGDDDESAAAGGDTPSSSSSSPSAVGRSAVSSISDSTVEKHLFTTSFIYGAGEAESATNSSKKSNTDFAALFEPAALSTECATKLMNNAKAKEEKKKKGRSPALPHQLRRLAKLTISGASSSGEEEPEHHASSCAKVCLGLPSCYAFAIQAAASSTHTREGVGSESVGNKNNTNKRKSSIVADADENGNSICQLFARRRRVSATLLTSSSSCFRPLNTTNGAPSSTEALAWQSGVWYLFRPVSRHASALQAKARSHRAAVQRRWLAADAQLVSALQRQTPAEADTQHTVAPPPPPPSSSSSQSIFSNRFVSIKSVRVRRSAAAVVLEGINGTTTSSSAALTASKCAALCWDFLSWSGTNLVGSSSSSCVGFTVEHSPTSTACVFATKRAMLVRALPATPSSMESHQTFVAPGFLRHNVPPQRRRGNSLGSNQPHHHHSSAAAVSSSSSLDEFVVGVLCAPKYVSSRLVLATDTWLRGVDAVVYLEDNAEAKSAAERFLFLGRKEEEGASASDTTMPKRPPSSRDQITFAYLVEPAEGPVKSRNGAWKNFLIISDLWKRFFMPSTTVKANSTTFVSSEEQKKRWFIIADDDTFVLLHNLQITLHTFYRDFCGADYDDDDGVDTSSTAHQEQGLTSKSSRTTTSTGSGGSCQIGSTHKAVRNILFVQGGGGIVLNRGGLSKLAAAMPSCEKECVDAWPFGDMRMGCCAAVAGNVSTLQADGFWMKDFNDAVGRKLSSGDGGGQARHPRRHVASLFPVSFHRYRTDASIAAARAMGSADEAFRANGSRIFTKWVVDTLLKSGTLQSNNKSIGEDSDALVSELANTMAASSSSSSFSSTFAPQEAQDNFAAIAASAPRVAELLMLWWQSVKLQYFLRSGGVSTTATTHATADASTQQGQEVVDVASLARELFEDVPLSWDVLMSLVR